MSILLPASGGGGGVGATDPVFSDSVTVDHAGGAQGFLKRVVRALTSVTSWQTIATITPSGVAGHFARGLVEATIAGVTNGVGTGLVVSRWYYDYSGAAPTVARIGTDTASGSGAPKFQLAVSGNDVLIQVESSDGTSGANMLVDAKACLPKSSGSISWAVA